MLWAGLRSAEGEQLYPPLVPGGEAGPGGWANWITGLEPGKGVMRIWDSHSLSMWFLENPDWDYKTFKFDATNGFDSDIDYMDDKLGGLFNATSPDLSKFRRMAVS